MLWVLKRTISMRRFFEDPKHMLKLMGKKIFTILHSDRCQLLGNMEHCSFIAEKHNFLTAQ